MQPEVIAAFAGVVATVLAAAIAYPVGRGVARRQAADAHVQWLRVERQGAAQTFATAAVDFIDAASIVAEAITRPDYAHTRRRDLESRKRLDSGLYEPLRHALRAMLSALPKIDLHGPDSITWAAEELYESALAMTGALLHCDAATVQLSVSEVMAQENYLTSDRAKAAFVDLDAAYARLAVPLGLSEFTTGAADMLHITAALGPGLSAMINVDDISRVAPAFRALEQLPEPIAREFELDDFMKDMDVVIPFYELAANLREDGGVPQDASEVFRLTSNVIPAFLDWLDNLEELLRRLKAEQSLDGEIFEVGGEIDEYLEIYAAHRRQIAQIRDYFSMGDELAAAAVAGQVDPMIAVAVWSSHLPALVSSFRPDTAAMNAINARIATSFVSSIGWRVDEARRNVNATGDSYNAAHRAFVEAVRKALGSDESR